MLHGVDVHARYQAGLQASALAGVDFVITKATGIGAADVCSTLPL